MNRNKYTAYLLGLISVCSSFSKINAMDSNNKKMEQTNFSQQYKCWFHDGIKCELNGNHLTITSEGHDEDYGKIGNIFKKIPNLRERVESVSFIGNITSIGDDAFKDCTNLKNVEIPDSVQKIGDYAFDGCRSLSTVNFKGSEPKIKEIGKFAFYNCKDLKNIEIPESVQKIEDYSFYGCRSLSTVNFKGSEPKIKEIGDCAFSGCESLTFIEIPKSVEIFGFDVFRHCTSLSHISILAPYEKIKVVSKLLPLSEHTVNNRNELASYLGLLDFIGLPNSDCINFLKY